MSNPVRERRVWGKDPDGAELSFPVLRFGEGDDPHILFIAGVHGDEYEGPLALLDLVKTLAGSKVRGRVTIIPIVNSPAFWTATRLSPMDGANLARTFPGDVEGEPTARLAAVLFDMLEDVDVLFDCHAGGTELCFLPVAGFYAAGSGVDAETAAASLRVATATGLPNLWELPSTGGVLSCEAARKGIAVTGCEIGGRGHARPEDVALYHEAFLNVMSDLDMIDAPPATTPLKQRTLTGDWTLAPASGLFRPLVRLGDQVSSGAELARIESAEGEVLSSLCAGTDGIVMAERNLCRVREGDLATLVARAAA